MPQTQHRNEYEKLPPNTTLLTKSQQKYSQYNPYYHTLDNRVLPSAQQTTSSSATNIHTDLNNTSDRFTKQINFNLNNVNHYYNSTKHCTDTEQRDSAGSGSSGVAATATNLHLSSKSIGYNTCNNSTIAKTKPYQNNICSGKKYDINNRNNNHDTYIEYLQKPIKMQNAEIIIEHSQLVLNGNSNSNDNTNPTNPMHRPNHYTQVISKFISHFRYDSNDMWYKTFSFMWKDNALSWDSLESLAFVTTLNKISIDLKCTVILFKFISRMKLEGFNFRYKLHFHIIHFKPMTNSCNSIQLKHFTSSIRLCCIYLSVFIITCSVYYSTQHYNDVLIQVEIRGYIFFN